MPARIMLAQPMLAEVVEALRGALGLLMLQPRPRPSPAPRQSPTGK
jgi:hypothetical protein